MNLRFLAILISVCILFTMIPIQTFASPLAASYPLNTSSSYIVALGNGKVVSSADIVTNPGTTGDKTPLNAAHAPIISNANTELSNNEQFKIYYSTTTTAGYKGTFLMQAVGRFVATNSAKLVADDGSTTGIDPRTAKTLTDYNVGGWESFDFVPQGDGSVAIKTFNAKKYVSLQADGSLKATVPYTQTPSDNEKFVIVTPTAPINPSGLTVTAKTDVSVNLEWVRPTTTTPGTQNAFYTGFNVYRSEDGGVSYTKLNTSLVVTTDPTTVTSDPVTTQYVYTDNSIPTGGHNYTYKVVAVNWAGESASGPTTNVVNVTTPNGPVPSAPTGLDINDTGAGNPIVVSWQPSPTAISYDVYRAASRYGTYTKITASPITSTTYTDSTYTTPLYSTYYEIVANNANGPSLYSNPISKETKLFGPNVYIFNNLNGSGAGDSNASVNKISNTIFSQQESNQFGNARYSLLFKKSTATYGTNFNVGFYTHVAGLGKLPTDSVLQQLTVNARWLTGTSGGNNATDNFWRTVENLTINSNTMWAVSQAAPMRRLKINGNLTLDDAGGWASGGFLADSWITGSAGSGAQQQWFNRNNQLTSWSGINWNSVLVGNSVTGTVTSNSGNPSNLTQVAQAPVVKEKPFLYYDDVLNNYEVFVPGLRTNASGTSWSSTSMGPGYSISIDNFYVAQPTTDTDVTINAALASGKNLILTPGIYHVSNPISVNNPDTVVLGLGLATITPDNGSNAMNIADVDGVSVSGIIFDAGLGNSPQLLQVGPAGSSARHTADPTLLSDLFFRIGGGSVGPAKAVEAMEINSKDAIGDHFWLWRADHGTKVGWALNTAKNGLVVNGDNFTMYGLFCEHFQEYETLWNGNGGKLFFFQNELPYDVPYQSSWISPTGSNGYSAYKVADNVTTHEAWGMGIYDVFINNIGYITLDNAVEVPKVPGVKIHNICTVNLASGVGGEITHIVNGDGLKVGIGSNFRESLAEYSEGLPLPVITPASGGYLSDQLVTITDADPTSVIYYSLNGTTPTRTNGPTGPTYTGILYTGPFTLQALESSLSATDHSINNITAVAFDNDSSGISQPATATYGFSIALNKPATASAVNPGSGNTPNLAFDLSNSTRWESPHVTSTNDPEWIEVDLQHTFNLSFARILWEATSTLGNAFQIETSIDGSTWTPISTVTGNTSTTWTDSYPTHPTARYVRMNGSVKGGNQYGWSMLSFEIYGTPTNPANAISSTYDPTTGILTLTGTDFVGNTDVSKITLKGTDNGTYTLTPASTTNAIVDPSGNTVTIKLGATDMTDVNALAGFNLNNTYKGATSLAANYLGVNLGSASTVDLSIINNPTYAVTYNGNGNTGGSVPTDPSAYVQGATVTVSDNTGSLVKTGYTFSGWNTAADGRGTDYAANATFSMGSANVTLYAKWTVITTAAVMPSQPDGQNGWYAHPVTVTLSTSNNVMTEYSLNGGATWQAYTSAVTFNQDGKYTLSYHSTDNAGNTEAVQTTNINLDSSAPVTTAVVSPSDPDGQNGWYVHPVTVTLNAADNLSGVAKMEYSLDGGKTWETYTAPLTYSQDSKYTISYRSTDNAGNVEATKTIGFNLDANAPTITVTGLVYGPYSDSQDITPTITPFDNLSGNDSSKMTVTVSTNGVQQAVQPGATISLYSLPLGSHAFIVSASDKAGNMSSQTLLFQTTTSIQSIQALITRFTNMGWIDNSGIAASLQSILSSNDLAGFESHVKAQSGKHISTQAANYLIRDAQYLLSGQ
ncbi:OmpL47-type beta-barrel domain-containing protein [Paenibacillus aestuarii]|uniref:OmpL47-type beta-barrel domain-containing protein n=1 Tax=Paenibacillus aestuarii TaxID=516965 RepID=A0ABW0K9T3_9BACL|nr:discoidin domain-containing protein [Paenibacillus aestuarii]